MNNKIKNFINDNDSIIIQIIFYIVGLSLGIVIYRNYNLNIEIENYKNLSAIIYNNLTRNIILFLIIFLFGTSIIGIFILNLFPLIFGIYMSLIVSNYYSLYNVKGIGISLLTFIPENIIIVLILFFTIELSKKMSRELLDLIKNKSTNNLLKTKYFIKKYLINFLYLVAFSSINSLLVFALNSIITI